MRRGATESIRRQRARAAVLLLALLAAMILPGRVSNAAGPVGPGTRDFAIVTGLPDGLPTPLAGAGAIRDASVIWISPADGIEQVRYFIDPASSNLEYGAVRGKPVAVATEAPFALQLDLESLSHGPHTLVAAIDLADGSPRLTWPTGALSSRPPAERRAGSHSCSPEKLRRRQRTLRRRWPTARRSPARR